MMANNMNKHELLGLLYQCIGATSIGIGIFTAVYYGMRPLKAGSVLGLPVGWEWTAFPFFFGLGAVCWSLGAIELKDVAPTSRVQHEKRH
jgi:hypothetical protein